MKQREKAQVDQDHGEGRRPADRPRVLVAVCTLNEAENIVPLLRQLRQTLPNADLLVIDDNSPDNTAKAAAQLLADDQKLQIHVRHQERGLGSAIREAMTKAVTDQFDFFINLDADFSHAPAQVPELLETAIQHPDADVVIGSRYVPGGKIVGWPLRRRLMSGMLNRFATLCLRLPVNDCSGSMRCYRVAALRRIGVDNLQIDGYAVLEEVLLSLHENGSSFLEVPITFTEREKGKSKLSLGEAIRATGQLIRLALRR